MTARTPGAFSASEVAMAVMRPLAMVLWIATAWATPAIGWSAAYGARPVTLTQPSFLLIDPPTAVDMGNPLLIHQRISKCADDRTFGELDFVRVVAARHGAGQRSVRGVPECCRVRCGPREYLLGLKRPPWFGGDAAERDARTSNGRSFHLKRHRGRGERELVGSAIAQLYICRVCSKRPAGQGDVRDQLARTNDRLPMRCVTREQMKFSNRNGAFAVRSPNVNARVEGDERDRHVRWMRRDAFVAHTEDGVDAVVAVHRRAARARLALVARIHRVAEVVAARALHQVAAGGRHVSQLRGGAGEDRLRKHPISRLNPRILRQIAVPNERADSDRPVGLILDLIQRQRVDVYECRRDLYVQLHQINERGSACHECRVSKPRPFDRLVFVRDLFIRERLHDRPLTRGRAP